MKRTGRCFISIILAAKCTARRKTKETVENSIKMWKKFGNFARNVLYRRWDCLVIEECFNVTASSVVDCSVNTGREEWSLSALFMVSVYICILWTEELMIPPDDRYRTDDSAQPINCPLLLNGSMSSSKPRSHQRVLFANEVVEAGCFATQLCTSVAWLTNTNQLGIPLLLFAPSAVASASPQFYPFGVPVQLTGYGRLILWYVSATDRRQLDKWIYRKHY